MIGRRILELAAMTMIGDSVLCMVSPRRHVSLWQSGPKWWVRTCEPLVNHPDMTRAIGLLGLGLGIWLAWNQEPQTSGSRSRGERYAARLMEAMQ